jgi:hypothetical protein
MFLANMHPTFIGQINLVSQRIRYRANHLGQLIHAVCRKFHCDASLNGKTLYQYVAAFTKSLAKPSSFDSSIIGCQSFTSQVTWAMASQSPEEIDVSRPPSKSAWQFRRTCWRERTG